MRLKRSWKEVCLWALGKRWRFRVQENSMLPTLRPGDDILVVPINRSTHLMTRDIIVCLHPLTANLRLVKRVSEIFFDGSCYVLSDNSSEGSDSRSFGVVGRELIIGKVTGRLI